MVREKRKEREIFHITNPAFAFFAFFADYCVFLDAEPDSRQKPLLQQRWCGPARPVDDAVMQKQSNPD